MLVDFKTLINKFNLQIRGIVHAGAHHGQEYDTYVNCGINNIIFIEPCKSALEVLIPRFIKNHNVKLFDCALGSECKTGMMHVEQANKGMSNSLLMPDKHLAQYPSIIFTAKEQVKVNTLDSLKFNRSVYNLLYMDIQGYELEALKGAQKTLYDIDYIYTEVNRDELYQNCAQVEQLDLFLKDFDRVYTDWGGGTWGDALYVRKRIKDKRIVYVPDSFKPRMKMNYPSDNNEIFESWYYNNTPEYDIRNAKRHYLPIFWTSYYVNHDYGKDKEAIDQLQSFINRLDKSKKYYTICQYDDGILNDLSRLDIKVFGMSHSKTMDYALPLICERHNYEFSNKRDILANFIGKRTHPIRDKILKRLKGNSSFYVSDFPHNMKNFCKILSKSIFTLCPRGYGATSFRIQEALQYGSIPVYISDEFLMPHKKHIDFKEYGVLIKPNDVPRIESILKAIPKHIIEKKQKLIAAIYDEYYSYKGNKIIIDKNI